METHVKALMYYVNVVCISSTWLCAGLQTLQNFFSKPTLFSWKPKLVFMPQQLAPLHEFLLGCLPCWQLCFPVHADWAEILTFSFLYKVMYFSTYSYRKDQPIQLLLILEWTSTVPTEKLYIVSLKILC